jgi:hypothetical protein
MVGRKHKGATVPDWLRPQIHLRVKPEHWLAKSRELKKAANLLFQKLEEEQAKYAEEFEENPDPTWPPTLRSPDDSVVTMLLGLAVENLLKGIHVSTLKDVDLGQVQHLSALKFPTSGHELEEIALKLPLEFSQDEIGVLQVLEHVILWFGRYPSARDIDNLAPADEAGHFKKFIFNYPEDHFAAMRLYDRLEDVLAPRAAAAG